MRQTPASAVVVSLAATALLAGSAHPAGQAHPGRNGLIAFQSERNGGGPSVYTMHTDGTGLVRLTGGAAPDGSAPAFSPDGRTLAFDRNRDDLTHDIWLTASDGTGLRPLLRDAGTMSTSSAAWSPDGRWIAFEGGPELDVGTRIYVVRSDGTGRRNLIDGSQPAWSPDGKRIAFYHGGGAPGIWTIGPEGRGLRRLHGGGAPAWSPDGRRIAFVKCAGHDCDAAQVYVMDANGSHEHKVTTNRSTVADSPEGTGVPAWSPDGRLLAVAACCQQPGENPVPTLDVVRPDGSGRHTLTNSGFVDPVWTHDGRRIVASGGRGLVMMNADGSGRRPFFAAGGGASYGPQWSPDGRRIVFDAESGAAVMNANGGNRRTIGDTVPYSWSPDGRRIVGEESGASAIEVLDVASGRSHWILYDDGAGDSTKEQPSWSPKGPIAYLDDYTVSLYTFGRRPPTQSLGFGASGGLEWSPDGRLLAYDGTGGIWVYDMKTKRRRLLIRNAFDAEFSPDGRRIAYVRNVTKTNTEIFVARSDGTGEQKITANLGADIAPSWQPVR